MDELKKWLDEAIWENLERYEKAIKNPISRMNAFYNGYVVALRDMQDKLARIINKSNQQTE